MPIRIPPEIKDQRFVISEISTIYRTPVEGLKEYCSNAIDNVTQYGQPSVKIALLFNNDWTNPQTKLKASRIIVMDNGTGIYWSKFKELPRNFGSSEKRGVEKLIGRKGFGVWAYGAVDPEMTYMTMYTRYSNDTTLTALPLDVSVQRLGQQLGARVISSRPPSSKFYYALTFPTNRNFLKGEDPTADVIYGDQLDPHVEFDHGTMVVISNVPQRIMPNLSSTLKGQLQVMFDPLIREGRAKIHLGMLGGRRDTPLEPIRYEGDVLVDETIQVSYVDSRGETKIGTIVAHIVRSDRKPSPPRVRLYNNGVLVRLLPGAGEEFNDDHWRRDDVTGYVVTNFLDVKTGRSEIQTDERFLSFVESMKNIGNQVDASLKRYQPVRRSRDIIEEWTDDFMKGLFEVLPGWKRKYGMEGSILLSGKGTDPVAIVAADGKGVKTRANGKVVPPDGSGGSHRQRHKNGSKPVEHPTIPPVSDDTTRKGRPGYKDDEGGKRKNVIEGSRVNPYIVERVPFEEPYSYLKVSPVYDPEGRTRPKIQINATNTERQEMEKLGKELLFRYDAELIASQIAALEIDNYCRTTQESPNVQFVTMIPQLMTDFLTAGLRRTRISI